MEVLTENIKNVQANAFNIRCRVHGEIITKVNKHTGEASSIKDACERAGISYREYYNAKAFFTKQCKKYTKSAAGAKKKEKMLLSDSEIMDAMRGIKVRKTDPVSSVIEESNKKKNPTNDKPRVIQPEEKPRKIQMNGNEFMDMRSTKSSIIDESYKKNIIQPEEKSKKKVRDVNEMFQVDKFLKGINSHDDI